MDENLNENDIHELEEVLSTKIYPGTEIMKDAGTHHFVKGHPSHSRDTQVLVPQPSDDPRDPLNWSPFWKTAAIISATAATFSLNLGPLALAPMFDNYIQLFDRSLTDVVQLTGVTILVLGFSNFIWVPMATCFGRRPVGILSLLLCGFASVWRARATSYDSLMGASVLHGLGAGPCDTLMPQVVADMMFLHDRGKVQTLYFAFYFMSLMVGPVIAGAMALHAGVESFWWLNAALLFSTAILCIFLLPETRYDRHAASAPAQTTATTTTAAAAAAAAAAGGSGAGDGLDGQNDEKPADRSSGEKTTTGAVTPIPASPAAATPPPAPAASVVGKGSPGRQQFLLFQPYAGGLVRSLWLPLYLYLYPIVNFAALTLATSAAGFLMVNLSQTQVFAAPPYSFSSETIGLLNLAVLVGAIIGLFTCGPLSDWVAARLTARNNGVREPEMRLVAMVPYVLIMVVGSVVLAVGYDNHWPWQVIVIVGYTFMGIQVAALPAIASTYAIDSYKPATGSIFVTITINKNLWGYGIGRFLTPWSTTSGFEPPILMNMGLLVFFSSTGILFWFWGKKLRGITANSFVHSM